MPNQGHSQGCKKKGSGGFVSFFSRFSSFVILSFVNRPSRVLQRDCVRRVNFRIGSNRCIAILICLFILGFSVPPASAASPAWKPLGLYGGSVQALAYSPIFPSDHTVFAAVGNGGSEGHGIFKSTDAGLTWTPANNGLLYLPGGAVFNVTSLAISPNYAVDHTIFAGSAGLWRSTDAGASWSLLASTLNPQSLAISPNFAVDRTLFASTGWAVSRSTDGGGTWQSASACCGTGLAVSPNFTADHTVFAGRSRSTDGGQTFTTVISGYNSGQAFVFSPGYASNGSLFHGDGYGQVLKSTDHGGTWNPVGNAGSNILSLAISPAFATDQTLWAGLSGLGLRRSIDGGQTWQPLTSGLSGSENVHAVVLSPAYASDGLLLAGSLSGLYRSTDRGDHWNTSQTGILGLIVRQVAAPLGFALGSPLFASTSQGLFKSTDGGASWQLLQTGGQALSTLVGVSPGYSNDLTVFALGSQGGQLYRSTDGGTTWGLAAQPVMSAVPSLWAISPQFPSDHTLWAAAKVSSSGFVGQLARSGNGAQSWSAAVEINRYQFPMAMALSPAFDQDGNALAATEAGAESNGSYAGLYATQDGGNTWPTSSLYSDCYSSSACWARNGYSAAFSPAYAADHTAFVGTRSDGVWRTTSGVAGSWSGGSFPITLTVQALAVSPAFSTDGLVWAGTGGAGVFVSANRGQTWWALNTGLADLRVNSLLASPNFAADNTLFAATESGLWVYTFGPLSHVFLPLVNKP